MRRSLIFLFISLIPSVLLADVVPEFAVVYFSSKAPAGYSLDKPQAFLSPRSVERRERLAIPFDSLDLPVNHRFVDSVLESGVASRVLYVSRWLNCAVVVPGDRFAAWSELPWIASAARVHAKRRSSAPLRNEGLGAGRVAPFDHSAAHLADMGIDALHRSGIRGEGVMVALLDGGFGRMDRLATFDSLFVSGRGVGTRDFVEGDDNVYDDNTHGTEAAALLAANLPGLYLGAAPMAQYLLLRTECTSYESRIEEFNWLAAAEYADSLGADLISTSLGYSRFDNPADSYAPADLTGQVAVVSRAAGIAVSRGIAVVASAGNDGQSEWGTLNFPADHPDVIAVGAVDSARALWPSSSPGMPFHAYKPDIVARGVDVWLPSTYGMGYYRSSGTSYAAPLVAGGLACLMQRFRGQSPQQLKAAVTATASRASTPDNQRGYGVPNFVEAYYRLSGVELPASPRESISLQSLAYDSVSRTIRAAVATSGETELRILLYDAVGRTLRETSARSNHLIPTVITISVADIDPPQPVFLVIRGEGDVAITQKIMVN